MKYLNLIIAVSFALVMISCGAKKEKTDELSSPDSEIIDETLDTNVSYEEFVADGFSDETSMIDSSNKEKMVYIDQSNEIQIDPPVENKKVEPVKEEPKKIEKAHETRYYVVAGSFKKYSNAQVLFDFFKKKGYQPLILPKVEGYNRVAIVSYSQESEARKALTKLRVDNNDITFWLYKW
jgi:hypothetical protein